MSKLYADIIINISHEALDRVFQYEVPVSLCEHIEIGMQVRIPFGRGNREQKGYVVRLCGKPSFDESRIKEIIDIAPDGVVIESQLIKLAYWIKENYGSTMINALKTVIPIRQKVNGKEDKSIHLKLDAVTAAAMLEEVIKKHYVAKERLLKELIRQSPLSYDLITKKFNVSKQTIDGMVKQGVVEILTKQVYRNPVKSELTGKSPKVLNTNQQDIIDEFVSDYKNKCFKTYLLFGVTGSGKTEVYMEAISKVIELGRQAIVLIPEISLTYQTVNRFYQMFGDRVSIINSRLSKGERYDQYLRAKRGEIDIVIGPRSALFTPFTNLGLIIMDEEHEGSYKSETAPKYHAREVAVERARMSGASVILGSATPSIESYTKAMLGEFTLFKMTKRVNDISMPDVKIVDLRQELKSGNRSMFSRKLRELMEDRLAKKQQIMLFINRRGYANFVSCRNCGFVMKCSHCDVALTAHNNGTLQCHYCGHTEKMPTECPSCHTKYIAAFGTGTQKVEEAVRKEFPGAKVLRMDMDTTKGKDGHADILSAFSNQDADILVGTQMIVKGHDFSNVTLVGVIAADLSLHGNDYRASERTFQLLTQAAGRAGRGSLPGEVIIQTYSPDHYSIITASEQNYEEFYEQEISFRRILKYPPVYQMLVIFIASSVEEQAILASKALHDAVKHTDSEISIIGPSDATLAKMNDIYRRVIYLKHLDYDLLVNIKNYLEGYIEFSDIFKNTAVLFDFNPMNMY